MPMRSKLEDRKKPVESGIMKKGMCFGWALLVLLVSSCSHQRIATGQKEVVPVRGPASIPNGDFIIRSEIPGFMVGDAEDEENVCWLDFSGSHFWRDPGKGSRVCKVVVTLSLKVTGSAPTDAPYLGEELLKSSFPELRITNGQATQLFEEVRVELADARKLAEILEQMRTCDGKVKLRYLDDATVYRAEVKFWSKPW